MSFLLSIWFRAGLAMLGILSVAFVLSMRYSASIIFWGSVIVVILAAVALVWAVRRNGGGGQ